MAGTNAKKCRFQCPHMECQGNTDVATGYSWPTLLPHCRDNLRRHSGSGVATADGICHLFLTRRHMVTPGVKGCNGRLPPRAIIEFGTTTMVTQKSY